MRHLRHIVLAAFVVALCIAPVSAAADSPTSGGAVVAPATGKWLGESWAQIYSLPISENPFAGNKPCLTLAHSVIQEFNGGPCTIEQGTALMTYFGTAWSAAEDPFPQTEAEQLALATAADRENVVGVTVSVDGGDPVDIRIPRYELFSPQRTVLLPDDDIFELPRSETSLTAHAWGAVIRKLSVGEHNVVTDVFFANGEHFTAWHPLTVVARTSHEESIGLVSQARH